MKKLLSLANSLEDKLDKILLKHKKLNEECYFLRSENSRLKELLDTKNQEFDFFEEELKRFKVANAMLGSDEYKRETKLKINSLIREIDKCISHLNGQ